MSTVLVTGASTGLGVVIARAFAQRGDTVYGGSRRATPIDGVRVIRLDVTDASSRHRALERIGPLDILVNNAAVTYVAPWEDTPDEDVRQVFETNFFAPLALIREVLPGMREAGRGRIINVTSLGAHVSVAFNGSYHASKHAFAAATQALRGEVEPFGIFVSAVAPGSFKTEIYDNAPTAEYSPPYADRANAYRERLTTRHGNVVPDYSPVIEAVLDAATAPYPQTRYLAAPPEQSERFGPLLEALESVERTAGRPT